MKKRGKAYGIDGVWPGVLTVSVHRLGAWKLNFFIHHEVHEGHEV